MRFPPPLFGAPLLGSVIPSRPPASVLSVPGVTPQLALKQADGVSPALLAEREREPDRLPAFPVPFTFSICAYPFSTHPLWLSRGFVLALRQRSLPMPGVCSSCAALAVPSSPTVSCTVGRSVPAFSGEPGNHSIFKVRVWVSSDFYAVSLASFALVAFLPGSCSRPHPGPGRIGCQVGLLGVFHHWQGHCTMGTPWLQVTDFHLFARFLRFFLGFTHIWANIGAKSCENEGLPIFCEKVPSK